MPAVRAVLGQVFRPEDDDATAAAGSRRDWIVDGVLFLLAAVLAIASVSNSARHGRQGPLLVIDAIGGVVLCLALWWRRCGPLELGLASVPVLVVSSSAGPVGVIILYTVAAYHRWQAAVLVAASEVVLLPLGRAIHPQGTSPAAYYLTGTLGPAVVVAWGMFRRSRRQAQRERARRAEAEEQLRIEQIRYAERTRIAREMHDVLAHRISLLSLHAGALDFRPDAPPEQVPFARGAARPHPHPDLVALLGEVLDGEQAVRAAAGDEAGESRARHTAARGSACDCRCWDEAELFEHQQPVEHQVEGDVQAGDVAAGPPAKSLQPSLAFFGGRRLLE
jgi:Histidine kinase